MQDNALEQWGASRLFARREKARQVAKAKASRPVIVPPPIEMPDEIEVFETASGIRAYRQWMPNLNLIGEAMRESARGTHVSLPYLSIMGARP